MVNLGCRNLPIKSEKLNINLTRSADCENEVKGMVNLGGMVNVEEKLT
jgi:hypothetical protein